MTLQQLEYIIALDTHKHFVTAAEHCHVTQPTLTIQVKKLEDEIGIVLFDRKKHPLKTTEAGELFITKARQILLEVDGLKEMVSSTKESLEGTFKIAVIPTVAPYLIPLFAKAFATKYPTTILEIEELKSEIIIDRLKKGLLDLGILVTPLEEENIREIPLYYEPFVFYGSSHHPLLDYEQINAEDLQNLSNLWLLNKGNCFRNQVLNLCLSEEEQASKSIVFDSSSIESVKRMVSHYDGFTLLPDLAISKTDQNIRPFADPVPVREVSIVSHNTFVKETLIDAIRQEILAIIPQNYEKNDRYFRVKWR